MTRRLDTAVRFGAIISLAADSRNSDLRKWMSTGFGFFVGPDWVTTFLILLALRTFICTKRIATASGRVVECVVPFASVAIAPGALRADESLSSASAIFSNFMWGITSMYGPGRSISDRLFSKFEVL